MDMNRMRGSKVNRTSRKGIFLPLFSELGEKQNHWIRKMARVYKHDFQLFGYDYEVEEDGNMYATCKEYDEAGMCI